MAVYKNVASQKIAVFAWDTVNSTEKTGDAANITAQISKDGGATAATDDVNPTELDATDAPGIYIFDVTQAETNADLMILFAKSATSDIKIEPVIIYTQPQTRDVNISQISGDSTAADNLELDYDGTGYNKSNSTIGTCTTNTDMITVANILTTQMTEAYAADGTAPTLAQALFLIQQSLHEFAITGTTRTVKKLDGSTTAATFTLDDDTSPTSTTRAS